MAKESSPSRAPKNGRSTPRGGARKRRQDRRIPLHRRHKPADRVDARSCHVDLPAEPILEYNSCRVTLAVQTRRMSLHMGTGDSGRHHMMGIRMPSFGSAWIRL